MGSWNESEEIGSIFKSNSRLRSGQVKKIIYQKAIDSQLVNLRKTTRFRQLNSKIDNQRPSKSNKIFCSTVEDNTKKIVGRN